jgi:transcription elongation factor GreA
VDGATRLSGLSDPVVITAAGLKALQAELEQLETAARREIAERIKTAREWGDLKENSEYHDAKNDQAHLETKILRLREQLVAAEVREVETQTEVVGFGSQVEVEDAVAGKTRAYTIVSAPEAAPADGRLSIDSPVGKALIGARVGDTVEIVTPRGERSLKVTAIG